MAGPTARAERVRTERDRRAMLVAATTALALAVLLWGGYVRHWHWTGLGAHDTVWDWLELALLPTAVATLPLWLRRRPLLDSRGRRALVVAVAAVAALVAAGYLVPLAWTGFPGNTLWDWLNLVALPVVLVFLGPWTDVARRIRTHPRRHVLALAVGAFAAVAVAGYVIPLAWTGFPGNTLWDWLQLLLMPLLVPTVLGPALLAWIAIEEPAAVKPAAQRPAGAAPAAATGDRRAAAQGSRLGWAAAGTALALVALAAGVAVGNALGSRSATPVHDPCAGPGAATVAVDGPARVVRAGASLVACRPHGGPIRIAPRTGAGRPEHLTMASRRVVYGRRTCPPGAAGCVVDVEVLRLADGRRIRRGRFPHSGPVAALAVSPRGALAVMLAACRRGPRCPRRLVFIDVHGQRVVDSGPEVDTAAFASGRNDRVLAPRRPAPRATALAVTRTRAERTRAVRPDHKQRYMLCASRMAVTLTQLVAFLAVVRRGSVTAAAEELVVTQPSVSAAVAALERELGVALTERAGRTLRPTPAGAAYAPYAADVLGLLEQGARAAREAADRGHRTLRISAVTTAGEFLLPPLIQGFRERFPDLEISLDVGNRADVFQRLADHEVDVAITGRVPEDGRLVGRPFMDNEWVLITAPGDPLAKRRWVAMEELASRPWLVREPGSGTRVLCEDYLAEHGIRPRLLTLGSNGAIKQAARVGLGVALQSRAAVELELSLGLLATIRPRGGLPHRSWYVVRATTGPVRDVVDAFMAYVESPAARHALARARDAGAERAAAAGGS